MRNRFHVGEMNPNAKLTAKIVREARAYFTPRMTQEAYAKRIGVSKKTLQRILARELWPHVQ